MKRLGKFLLEYVVPNVLGGLLVVWVIELARGRTAVAANIGALAALLAAMLVFYLIYKSLAEAEASVNDAVRRRR